MSSLQIIALVWTILSSIGAARARQMLTRSRADRAFLKKEGLNGPMDIMAVAFIRTDVLRMFFFLINMAIGVVALISDGGVGRWLIRIGIFGALVMIEVKAEIISKARQRIMRYHPGSASDRRAQGKEHK